MAMRLLAASQKKIGKYDVAISFRHPDIEYNFLGGGNEFVLKCCAADEKITFIHGDYQKYGGNCKYNQEMLEQFDKIAAVSEGCMNSFLNTLPQMKNKTSCVYNCHNYKEICALAENDTVYYNHECSVFVTVCRLGAEKGLTRAINILAELKNRGMRFTWYIIGDGEEKEHIQKVIQEKDMCSDIILGGAQKNPYRYIKDADFFLLPSIHEAAPMVIGESLCLGVPVVSTATSSAQELIGVDGGIVCDNTEEAILEMLYSVLSGENKRLEECRRLLKSRVFNNKKALEQFERLLQGEEK